MPEITQVVPSAPVVEAAATVMMYKAKFRANGVTYYINTKNRERRDAAVEFHRSAGIDVEVYEAPAHAQPEPAPADPGTDVMD
jgi:hypothetical protein